MKASETAIRFLRDEDGSVIVDWAILTAALIGLSAFFFDGIGDSIEALANDINTTLISLEIPTTFAAYGDLPGKAGN